MKTFIKKIYVNLFKIFFLNNTNQKYINTQARIVLSQNIKSDFVLITTAFNSIELIKLQYDSLLKNLEDKFDYIIADNSSDEEQSRQIESFCREKEIYYIRLPKNPGLDGSISHGLALNWVFYNFIQKTKPKYFGFIDHDIFLINKDSFLKHLEKNTFWGIKGWAGGYLWPGFSFFCNEWIGKSMNFLPLHRWFGKNFDTGGSNAKFLKGLSYNECFDWNDGKVLDINGSTVWQFGNVVHIHLNRYEIENYKRLSIILSTINDTILI